MTTDMPPEECIPCKAKRQLDDAPEIIPTSRVDHAPLLNCLSWNLYFQKLNKDFIIFYNGDHVISLHFSTPPPSGYTPLLDYGFNHMVSSFKGLLSSDEEDMLYDYIDSNPWKKYASTMYEISLDQSYLKGDKYEFVFDGSVLQIPFPTFRFSAFTKEHALDLLPSELKPKLIELTS